MSADRFNVIAEEIAESFHVHECEEWKRAGMCEAPCKCSCGATLEMSAPFDVDGRWAWHLVDDSWAPFPDPALRGE